MAIGGLGVGTGLFDRASAAGDPPGGARPLDDSPCPPGHNTPLPLRRSAPASFKRLLGSPLAYLPSTSKLTAGHVGRRELASAPIPNGGTCVDPGGVGGQSCVCVFLGA